MKIYKETERLILREITSEDEQDFWRLDSNPDVHRYLGNKPVTSIEQCKDVISFIRQQYEENGIGRWALIEKSTNRFIGWVGLKLIKDETNKQTNYYDLGYRIIKEYWGNGYASEGAVASLEYGFENLALQEIYAMADSANSPSINVLLKSGFKFIKKFHFQEVEHSWFKITKNDWAIRKSNSEYLIN